MVKFNEYLHNVLHYNIIGPINEYRVVPRVIVFFDYLEGKHFWHDAIHRIEEIYPRIRVHIVKCDCYGKFNERESPSDLVQYSELLIMSLVIMIPGNVWDGALKYSGRKNPIKIGKNVRIFNLSWKVKEVFDNRDNILIEWIQRNRILSLL